MCTPRKLLTLTPQVERYVRELLRGRKAFADLTNDEHQRILARDRLRPLLNSIEKVCGYSCEQIKAMMGSKKLAEKKRLREVEDIKAKGVAEYRKALEKSDLALAVTTRYGAGVSLTMMQAIANAASLESHSDAEARGGKRSSAFRARRQKAVRVSRGVSG